MMRPFLIVAGSLSLVLGGFGIVVPLLPSTPFVLLGAACFAKSSPTLHGWLSRHALFGPVIADWQTNGAIAPRAKAIAVATMATTLLISVMLHVSSLVIGIQVLVLTAAALFLLTRPNTLDAIPQQSCNKTDRTNT